jgi:hypothetical protein
MPSTRRKSQKNGLIGEVELYLGVVDSFRREGCEPRWLPEDRAAVCAPLAGRWGAVRAPAELGRDGKEVTP